MIRLANMLRVGWCLPTNDAEVAIQKRSNDFVKYVLFYLSFSLRSLINVSGKSHDFLKCFLRFYNE